MAVNFGIIGCGIAGGFHLGAISKIPGARVAGVCDSDTARAKLVAAEHGAKAFLSPSELVSGADIDAVCVCSPSSMHYEHALAAIRAGKHVVIEKPVALRVCDAETLLKESQKHGVKAAVISQLCFSPAVKQLKACVAEGLLGRLISVTLHMKYYRAPEYYTSSAWKGTKAFDGGGALMNQGIHGVDILRHICGPVKSITAHARTLSRSIEVEDTLAALLELQNGALCTIEATVAAWPGSPRRLEISGELGTAVLEEDTLTRFEIKDAPDTQGKSAVRGSYSAHDNPESIGLEGHILQLSDFVYSVETDGEVYVGIEQGRDTLEIVQNAYLSSQLGKTIYF